MQDTPSNVSKAQSGSRKSDTPTGAAAGAPGPEAKKPTRRSWLTIISVAVLAVVAAGTYGYWQYATLYPSTENAYVEAKIVQIAPLVTGVVSEVSAKEFAHVKSGDVLLKLDPAPFDAALKAAQAHLNIAKQQAGVASGAQAIAAKANLEQAQAGVDRAQAELDHATIKAPTDGIVGKVATSVGAVARAGIPLFPLVDTSAWWVDANFKETDLTRIEPGQKATVSVDLFPSHELSGEVEAISPASVSAFSLLPPENATGSWVKVTQRFPVRIKLNLKSGDPEMRVGASASVTVDTKGKGSNSDGQ
jgi:membrane fusion protein (multidrug efflux system)